MSWLHNLSGDNPPPPYRSDDSDPKVRDPANPSRMVSTKQANQPFLAHKQYRNEQEKLHNDWVERKRLRDFKIAKGEPVGPEERDPTAEREIGARTLIKLVFALILIASFSGKFLVGSYTWGYDSIGKWDELKATYWPSTPSDLRLFTERQLAEYDGKTPDKPIYIAIDGNVYDVSKNARTYGPGGSYHLMAGIDAARSFGTGCFKTHRTHDLRGLTESELRGVQHWKGFFDEHKDYPLVGRVSHPPIDPASPVPEHCNPKKDDDSSVKKETKEATRHPDSKKAEKRVEL